MHIASIMLIALCLACALAYGTLAIHAPTKAERIARICEAIIITAIGFTVPFALAI